MRRATIVYEDICWHCDSRGHDTKDCALHPHEKPSRTVDSVDSVPTNESEKTNDPK